MTEMSEEEFAPIRAACFEFAKYFAEIFVHESSSKADIARSQSLAALPKVRRAIEALIEARGRSVVQERCSAGAAVDNSACKFANRGACCVSHCGDPVCIASRAAFFPWNDEHLCFTLDFESTDPFDHDFKYRDTSQGDEIYFQQSGHMECVNCGHCESADGWGGGFDDF